MRFSALLLIAVAVCGSLLTAGCGKKGMPQPRATSETFKFANVTLTPAGDCFTVQGALEGNRTNVDELSLELEAVGPDFDCPTCPFRPSERQDFSKEEAGLFAGDTFTMQYCPRSDAAQYRWRIIGKNVYQNLDYAVSPVRMTEDP